MEGFVTYLGCPPQVWGLMVAAIVCLMISAMVSSSEVAFFSLTAADIRDIRSRGTVASDCVLRLLSKSDTLLATILVVNNLVNICIVILTTMIIGDMLQFNSATADFLFKGVFVTFLLLLFGEILPKVFAQGATVRVALAFAQPLSWLRRLVYPLSYILIRTSRRIGKMASHGADDISIEELADAVDMTTASSGEEKRMLSEIVNFANREVDEIMRPRMDIESVELTMTFGEVKRVIMESGYSRLPVCDEDLDHIKGTLFVKDLLAHIDEADDFGWQRLVRDPYFVPQHKKINAMLEDFQSDKVHMAIVVDEYGATQGLVSLEDILEEVVGEITDESDTDESFYNRLNENTYLFDGKTHIVDMSRVLQLDDNTFDDVQGRAETIAGLMLEIKRDLLKKGDEVVSHGIRFVVYSMSGHRVDKIKVIVNGNE